MSPSRVPAAVFWRRRLLVLAALIALAWVVLRHVPDGDDPAPAATPDATTPSARPSTTPTPEAAPTEGLVPVSLTTASKRCDPRTVRVTPSVRGGQTTQGPVDIGLVVSSTSPEPCTLTAADADLLVVISSDDTPVYDSTVCKVSLLKDPVELTPRWATLATAVWSGRGSGRTCAAREGFVPPGRYVVQLGTLGGEPGETAFTLEREKKQADEKKSDERTADDTSDEPAG